jgi:LacI family transcriptional regulator
MKSLDHRSHQKRVALVGLPILQEFASLTNVALAHHASCIGNWRFVFQAENTPESFRFLRNLKCDGAIVRITTNAMRREAMKLPFPVVNISSWLEDAGVPTVRTDWDKLGRMAAEHLLEKGYRRFGCVVMPGGWYIQARFCAFAEAIRQKGLKVHLFHLRTTNTQPDQSKPLTNEERRRFKQWVTRLQPPAALVLTDDWDAPSLMDACREIGFQIPRDLVMLSTGIHAEVLPQCHPALTGAQEDLQTQAQMTIELLEALMAGKPAGTAIINVPPLGIIERASTATMAIEDREVAHAVEFIRAHGCEPVNIGSLMDRAGISRSTMDRRFAEIMGQTPHDFLIQQRVQRAKELLCLDDSLNMESIAKQCGFRDFRELKRVFKRLTGILPRDWKKSSGAADRSSIRRNRSGAAGG